MNCLQDIVRYILYIFNIIFMVWSSIWQLELVFLIAVDFCFYFIIRRLNVDIDDVWYLLRFLGIFITIFLQPKRVGGVLLIILGSIMTSDMRKIEAEAIPIIIIVLGCIIFVISFFGFLGAFREIMCCLWTYAACMFILLCLQIALIVWIFVKQSNFVAYMSDVVQDAWNENIAGDPYPMQAFELAFDCCGVVGYQDYTSINQAVPSTCCGTNSTNDCPMIYYMLQPGCQAVYTHFWSKILYIIRWGGLGVAIVEFIALIFAFCVMSGIRNPKIEVYEVEVTT